MGIYTPLYGFIFYKKEVVKGILKEVRAKARIDIKLTKIITF